MRLIVNGDDLGISHAVNLAMIDCFTKGIMSSASMMVNMPYAKEAAALMKEYPGLSVGLHLNLTVGFPLLKNYKTLLKADGSFNKGILQMEKGQVDLKEAEAECRAQLDKFIELTGQMPDHINSHHGIEMIPGAQKILQNIAEENHLPIRQFMEWGMKEEPVYTVSKELPLLKMVLKKDGTSACVKDWKECFSQEELKSNAAFEMAAHPGYVDYDLLQVSSLTSGRCHDANTFMSKELQEWIAQNKVELITYKDLQDN
jgi:hypothetical protein